MNNNLDEIILAGRINGQQKTRLKRLLNMMYRPSELAAIVGFSKRQVYRVYIPMGLPHERDERQHIWINGVVFRDWMNEIYKKRKLKENEAFCLTCRKPVEKINAERLQKEGLIYDLSICPHCDRKLGKIIDKKVVRK